MTTRGAFEDGLNPEQAAVVRHGTGPLLVAAVAGSGKTSALVRRIARLVSDGVEPERILAVTFSKKAADEMNERLHGFGISRARVGTFHSLALNLIRREIPETEDYEIDDRDRYHSIIKDAIGFRGIDWKAADLTVVSGWIGRCKAQPHRPGSPGARAFAEDFYAARPCQQRDPGLLCAAYETAEKMRIDRRLMTFDDMLVELVELLRRDEATRARIAAQWDYVLQDECQDESPVQGVIAEALARDHRNYMVVGDPGQSIYKFRGADPTRMISFDREWGATVIKMHRNYRCGSSIVKTANGVLRAMDPSTHLGVEITAELSHGGDVRCDTYIDHDDEGQSVARSVQESRESGRQWGDHVVLYRTNAQSRGIEEAMLSARIPYIVIGGTNFYDRREVRDLLAYLRLAAGRGRFDDVRRSINTPFRFLGRVTIDSLQDHVDDRYDVLPQLRSFLESGRGGLQRRQVGSVLEYCSILDAAATRIRDAKCGGDPALPARILEDLFLRLDYAKWLTRDEGTESPENNRVSNVRELIRSAERFTSVDGLLDYIEYVRERAQKAKSGDRGDVVTLMSIHRSKGLEWPVVYVIGCNEQVLPHGLAEDIGEERRLFYVAATRARDVLALSCVLKAAIGSKVVNLAPSRFLSEAGLVATQRYRADALLPGLGDVARATVERALGRAS